jgi:hypothetical protein
MTAESPDGKPPTKCTICNSSRRQKIEDAIADGIPRDEVIARFGLSRSSFDRHRAHLPVEPRARTKIPPPSPPRILVNGSAHAIARGQVEWLGARLQWLHETGAPEREIARVVVQYSSALRTLSKLEANREPGEKDRYLNFWQQEAVDDFDAASVVAQSAGARGDIGAFRAAGVAAIEAIQRFFQAPRSAGQYEEKIRLHLLDFVRTTQRILEEGRAP